MNTMLEDAFIEKINALQTSDFLMNLIENYAQDGGRLTSYYRDSNEYNSWFFTFPSKLKCHEHDGYITLVAYEIINTIGNGPPDISNKDYYLHITFKDNKTIIELH